MKLVYTRWKYVKSFLASMDEPFYSDFCIKISTRLQDGRWVYDVEVPREVIDRSSLKDILDWLPDNRIE